MSHEPNLILSVASTLIDELIFENNRLSIQDLLIYCERLETTLEEETTKLTNELRDCRLDLVDSTTSRRTLQHQINTVETQLNWLTQENDTLKVPEINLVLSAPLIAV